MVFFESTFISAPKESRLAILEEIFQFSIVTVLPSIKVKIRISDSIIRGFSLNLPSYQLIKRFDSFYLRMLDVLSVTC